MAVLTPAAASAPALRPNLPKANLPNQAAERRRNDMDSQGDSKNHKYQGK